MTVVKITYLTIVEQPLQALLKKNSTGPLKQLGHFSKINSYKKGTIKICLEGIWYLLNSIFYYLIMFVKILGF